VATLSVIILIAGGGTPFVGNGTTTHPPLSVTYDIDMGMGG